MQKNSTRERDREMDREMLSVLFGSVLFSAQHDPKPCITDDREGNRCLDRETKKERERKRDGLAVCCPHTVEGGHQGNGSQTDSDTQSERDRQVTSTQPKNP